MTPIHGSSGDAVEKDDVLPPASLIIPSRNRPDILAETVASILRGEHVPAELIIIDQSDSPHPELSAMRTDRPCEIRYQWTSVIGVSRARNTGIQMASHPILAFTDDDILATPSWFGTLIRSLTERGVESVVTGQVKPADEGEGGVVLSTVVDDVPAVYEGRVGVDILFPPNMALYRSVLDEVGLFDLRLGWGGRFPTAEDNDLGFRILEAGYRIHYVPEPIVYHRAWRPVSDYLSLKWKYSRGQGAYYAKHFHIRDRHMFWRLVSELRLRTGRLFRCLPSNPRRAIGQIVSIVGVSSAFAEWLILRPDPE